MPMHDWKKVPVGLYHHFHQQWIGELCDALNGGGLPQGYFALVDYRTSEYVPDVLAVAQPKGTNTESRTAATMVLEAPKVRYHVQESDNSVYAKRANSLAVRNDDGELVTIIELVSPGNKDSRRALRKFIDKALEFLYGGVNMLIIDPFPPTRRDPEGIHKAIWDEIMPSDFELPASKPLTVVSYLAAAVKEAFVETLAPGDTLPEMPLFLSIGGHVPAPLERSYQACWAKVPKYIQDKIEASTAKKRSRASS
jgi:hypothetical protein